MRILDLSSEEKTLVEAMDRSGPKRPEERITGGESVVDRPGRGTDALGDVGDRRVSPVLDGRVPGGVEDLF